QRGHQRPDEASRLNGRLQIMKTDGIDKTIAPLDDFIVSGEECECEFSRYEDEPDEESYHFRRRC
ncbi:MAG: hypothetical protein KDK05_33060, partial [Candidatus Competibacteraceae bacterium]|nr:hypothetical protein [Candidatus Competibacteraceae bacterium]